MKSTVKPAHHPARKQLNTHCKMKLQLAPLMTCRVQQSQYRSTRCSLANLVRGTALAFILSVTGAALHCIPRGKHGLTTVMIAVAHLPAEACRQVMAQKILLHASVTGTCLWQGHVTNGLHGQHIISEFTHGTNVLSAPLPAAVESQAVHSSCILCQGPAN
jgi:hypothetical protein